MYKKLFAELEHSTAEVASALLPNGLAVIVLNRPKALHALTTSACQQLYTCVKNFAENDACYALLLMSSTEKAFCAGGDVRAVRDAVINGRADVAEAFFQEEYQLDLYLHQLHKPLVVWGEGYVMGGGMGLFMAGDVRLVTPSSRLAMPEISIGLFPDVGGSKFLAQLGRMGLFLGLTASQLNAGQAVHIGMATHVCALDRYTLLDALSSLSLQQSALATLLDWAAQRHQHAGVVVTQEEIALMDYAQQSIHGTHYESDIQHILAWKDHHEPWLNKAASTLQTGAPSTAALTWLLWHWAGGDSLPRQQALEWPTVFECEGQMVSFKMRQQDFLEGVRAKLVDKDNAPQWHCDITVPLETALGTDEERMRLKHITDSDWQHVLATYVPHIEAAMEA